MDRYESLLNDAFEKALNTEEIQNARAAPELVQERLRKSVQDHRQDLLSQASSLIGSVDASEKEVERIREEARSVPAPPAWALVGAYWGTIGLMAGVVGFVAVVLLARSEVTLFSDAVNFADPLPSVPPGWLLTLGLAALGILSAVLGSISSRRDLHRLEWVAGKEESLGLSGAEHDLDQMHGNLQSFLENDVVLPFLREEVGRLRPPEDSTDIGRLDRTGLVEVHDLQFQVPTPAHEQLERLVDETRSGTIGVSGSRGAGKTTLLRYFCRPDLPDTPLEERRIRVFVSAPVEYAARDFVLHVFSELCYGFCDALGVERSAFRTSSSDGDVAEENRVRRLQGSRKRAKQARNLLLGMALILSTLAIVGLVAELWPSSATENVAATTDEQREESGGSEGEAAPQAGGESVSSPSERGTSLAGSVLTLLRTNKKTLFDYSLGLAVLAMVVWWALPYFARQRAGEVDFGPRWKRPRLRSEGDAGPGKAWQEAYRLALDHLENIHFQQSFSSGWNGSLSTPLVSIDHSLGRSLSARQESLPEIMSNLRAFIERLPVQQPVIVAIDELDKMASPEKAERFLNDIKSIFGIPRCVYIVSVSLQAMSRFNRRGLPFRDTFDSSFDEMIHVRYFDLARSTRLLSRRVIGLPPIFHALCHLFAGGLPRDLIRACRTLLTVRDSIAEDRDEPVPLERLCDEMVRDEIQSQLDALEVEAVSDDHEAPVMVLESLRDLLERKREICDVAWEVRESPGAPSLRARPGDDGSDAKGDPSPGDGLSGAVDETSDGTRDLAAALASYLYYLATVRDLVAQATESGAVPPAARIDRLARVRPEIGLDPARVWDQISSFRALQGFGVQA